MTTVIRRKNVPTVIQRQTEPTHIRKAAPTVVRMNPATQATSYGGPDFSDPDNSAWMGII